MTNDLICRAIRSCEDRLDAYENRLENCSPSSIDKIKRQIELEECKISALRAQEKEPCEWCSDEVVFDSEDMKIELQHPLEDEPRMVYPRFCPMCGRPLK